MLNFFFFFKDTFAAFATWVIASVATILGHWVVLWAHDKSGRTPESKSELVLPYLVVTAGERQVHVQDLKIPIFL